MANKRHFGANFGQKWPKKWPKMMKIEVLLVGHPITQPTGQDWFISFCKIKQNSQPCYLMESAIFQIP